MKYKFSKIENGQIASGGITIQIVNGRGEVDPANPDQVKLAEKHGGQPARKRRAKKEALND